MISIKRRIKAVMGGLILASLLASFALANQGFPQGSGKGRGRLWSALQLSDDQRAQIKNIFANSRESIRPLHQQLQEKRTVLREAMAASPFDEERVRFLAQELSSAQTEMIVRRARLMNEALGVLTSEQRAKLEDLRQQRQQRFQEWRERHRGRPDQQKG